MGERKEGKLTGAYSHQTIAAAFQLPAVGHDSQGNSQNRKGRCEKKGKDSERKCIIRKVIGPTRVGEGGGKGVVKGGGTRKRHGRRKHLKKIMGEGEE